MPPKVMSNIGEMYIENLETGERTKFEGISDISIDYDECECDYEPMKLSEEFSFTLDIAEMPILTTLRLLGLDGSIGWKIVQNKQHKKKRINKKWAKKYGYTCLVWCN